MNSEIRIILEKSDPYAKGNCFEVLVRNVLESQRYQVESNINYTGMEIDLVAKHMDRIETAYVECKARDKIDSGDVRKFAFNVQHKRVDHGYFITTRALQHQAAGLVNEMKEDVEARYKNLLFFNPTKVIDLLVDAGKIYPIRLTKVGNISKHILAVTHLGDYHVALLQEGLAPIPTRYVLLNAQDLAREVPQEIDDLLRNDLGEIVGLERVKHAVAPVYTAPQNVRQIETLSEVQESENWYDYLPASSKHFVGRDELRQSILGFLQKVTERQTARRIFYLSGKSGWGKSSLVAEIRGRSRNKRYRKKFYVKAIDCRSATSSNFVALAFEKLISDATEDGFIETDLFHQRVSFASNQDLLSSETIRELLSYLRDNGKCLVLVFDQFEDIFRKDDLFIGFYKLLTDATDVAGNFVVGFSWRTEILISSENPSYHLWQQAKEQSEQFTVPEFGSKETNLIIAQLENSIGSIDLSLKRRLFESSQGYPWLLKKLCIHVFEQVRSGKDVGSLIEENLNFEHLFSKDLEQLSAEEAQALQHIAKRAYEGRFFEMSEVNDLIPEHIVNSLRDDRRLIIRSGLNYNIYWDIFRDYLVTKEIPIVLESYIIRSAVGSCVELFVQFETQRRWSISGLRDILPTEKSEDYIENCLMDLRSLGLIRKLSTEEYVLSPELESATEDSFKSFMRRKFGSYSVTGAIRSSSELIDNNRLVKILKRMFKGYSHQENTWRTYANYLLGWFFFAEVDFKDRLVTPTKGAGAKLGFIKRAQTLTQDAILRIPPEHLVRDIMSYLGGEIEELPKRTPRELALLGLVHVIDERVTLSPNIKQGISEAELASILARRAETLPLIEAVLRIHREDSTLRARKLLEKYPQLLPEYLKPGSRYNYMLFLQRWAKFIEKHST